MKDQLLTYPDLASERLGATVVYATDETHGHKENLNTLTSSTLKTDSWSPKVESSGKAWAVIRLACETNLVGFLVETASKEPIHIEIDALCFRGHVEDWELADFLDWDTLVPKQNAASGVPNFFTCKADKNYTHIRVHLYSNGGISQVRAFGTAFIDWNKIKAEDLLDLAAITHGGKVLSSSVDLESAQVLVAPTKSRSAEDGWYPNQRQHKHWVIIKLAHRGFIEKMIIDTYNFHDNRAESCAIDYCMAENDQVVVNNKIKWMELMNKKGLKPHRENPFSGKDIRDHEAITHIRLKIYSNGGISRVRIIGCIKK